MSATLSSRREIEQALISKAESDPSFKNTLIANPRSAIRAALGIELPTGIEVSVLQETSRSLYLVLPASPTSGELADAELAVVAGGKKVEDAKDSAAADKETKGSLLGTIFGA